MTLNLLVVDRSDGGRACRVSTPERTFFLKGASAASRKPKSNAATIVDFEIQGAYRRLARARRLRQSAEKLLAVAKARGARARRNDHRKPR